MATAVSLRLFLDRLSSCKKEAPPTWCQRSMGVDYGASMVLYDIGCRIQSHRWGVRTTGNE